MSVTCDKCGAAIGSAGALVSHRGGLKCQLTADQRDMDARGLVALPNTGKWHEHQAPLLKVAGVPRVVRGVRYVPGGQGRRARVSEAHYVPTWFARIYRNTPAKYRLKLFAEIGIKLDACTCGDFRAALLVEGEQGVDTLARIHEHYEACHAA